MKEFIIFITMFFAEPNTYPNALQIAARHGEPLSFATEQKCHEHINENFDILKKFAMSMYPNAVTVKNMFCAEKENGLTGV
tara:strand:+ start:163 stop:405 length:243 start_codon:yes stop_codon:yes gene_type:complete